MYKVLSSVGLVSLIVKTAVFIIFIRVLQSFMAFFLPFPKQLPIPNEGPKIISEPVSPV